MNTKTINWKVGGGTINLSYEGNGNGAISVTCSANKGGGRNQDVTIKTTDSNSPKIRVFRVYQEGESSIDGGISTTTKFNEGIDCSISDSTYNAGVDDLYDCGGADV